MKHIYKFILEGCGLSVLITSIFFVFEGIASPEITPALPLSRYFLILLFGFIVVGANLLFSIEKLHRLAALAIHYIAIFVAFLIVFIGFADMTAKKFFIYAVIFTILYAIVSAVVIGVKNLTSKIDDRISAKTPTAKKQNEYKPRYK